MLERIFRGDESKKDVVYSFASSYFALFVSISGVFALAKTLPPDSFGSIVIWTNMFLLLAALGSAGMPMLALRLHSSNFIDFEYGVVDPKSFLLVCISGVFVFSLITIPLLVKFTNYTDLFSGYDFTLGVMCAASHVCIHTLCLTARGQGSRFKGLFYHQAWRSIGYMVASVLGVSFCFPNIFVEIAILLTGLIISTYLYCTLRKVLSAENGGVVSTAGRLLKLGLSFWVASLLPNLIKRADILIVGNFVGLQDAALYLLVQRLAEIPAMLSSSLNSVIGPRFSLYTSQKKPRSEYLKLLAKTVALSVSLGLSVVLGIGFFGGNLLSFFNPLYVNGNVLLTYMLLASLVSTVTKPCIVFLNMSGHQSKLARVMVVSGPIQVVLIYLGVVNFHLEGAVIARSLGFGCIQLVLAIFSLRLISKLPNNKEH